MQDLDTLCTNKDLSELKNTVKSPSLNITIVFIYIFNIFSISLNEIH